jgi:hypothetical protein
MYWSRMIHHLNIRGHLGSLNEFDHFRPSGHPRTWPHGRISPSGRLRARMRVVILACGKAGGLDLPIQIHRQDAFCVTRNDLGAPAFLFASVPDDTPLESQGYGRL